MNSMTLKFCRESSPKEIALYQSVISMLQEGASTSGMKVSEIASRAGVGKGTTYEYFNSKEDLIVRAILYDVKIKVGVLEQRIQSVKGFKEIYFTIMDWIDENLQAKHVLSQVFGLSGLDYQLSGEVRNIMMSFVEETDCTQRSLMELIHIAQEEGLISETVPESLKKLSFINGLISYMAYLRLQETITDVSKQEIKEFLYNSMIHALQS